MRFIAKFFILGRIVCLFIGLGSITCSVVIAASIQPPGVIIDHVPATSGRYVGSPSIVTGTNGYYLASHDFFGPKSNEHQQAVTAVFCSRDRGVSWQRIAIIDGQFWSSLFVNSGVVYLLGTDRHHGNVIIRRSADGGKTWTTPLDNSTGLLRDDGEYHCAPTPVIEFRGRLWRGMERRKPAVGWGSNYCAGVLSAPISADLLAATNWTFSNFLPSDRSWNKGDMRGWLEGNVVITPAGQIFDVLRVDTLKYPEKAALVSVSRDGEILSFDPATGFVNLPGGAKKFTIRYDPLSRSYWTLVNVVPPESETPARPATIRNLLALTTSKDLTNWTQRAVCFSHSDPVKHGFQYVDWQFEGDDIIAACRTASDDQDGGAHTYHDANFLTFHRVKDFRNLSDRSK